MKKFLLPLALITSSAFAGQKIQHSNCEVKEFSIVNSIVTEQAKKQILREKGYSLNESNDKGLLLKVEAGYSQRQTEQYSFRQETNKLDKLRNKISKLTTDTKNYFIERAEDGFNSASVFDLEVRDWAYMVNKRSYLDSNSSVSERIEELGSAVGMLPTCEVK